MNKLEISLWFILYLSFIIPVAKILYYEEVDGTFSNRDWYEDYKSSMVALCLIKAVFYPVLLPIILVFTIVSYPIEWIYRKSSNWVIKVITS